MSGSKAIKYAAIVAVLFINFLPSFAGAQGKKRADTEDAIIDLIILAQDHYGRRDFAKALPAAQRAVALAERKGDKGRLIGTSLELVGKIQIGLNRLDRAEKALLRAIDLVDPRDSMQRELLDDLVGLYGAQIRAAEIGAPTKPDTLIQLNVKLADIHVRLGRFGDAEPLFKKLLNELGPGASDLTRSEVLAGLGWIHFNQKNYADAEAEWQEALRVREKLYGASELVAKDYANLGSLYYQQKRYRTSIEHIEKALSIRQQLKSSDRSAAVLLCRAAFRAAEANEEPKLAAAYLIRAAEIELTDPSLKAPGSLSASLTLPIAADYLHKAALLTERANDVAGAQRLAARALKVYGDYVRARPELRKRFRTMRSLVRSPDRMALALDQDDIPRTAIQLDWDAAQISTKGRDDLANHAFQALQSLNSNSVSDTLNLTIARLATTSGPAREIIREWQTLQRAQLDALAANDSSEKFEAAGRQMQALMRRIERILPNYMELIYPNPVSITDVQATLDQDEVLLAYHVDAQSTFLWGLTKASAEWARIDRGLEALVQDVEQLRCGLDFEGSWEASNCAKRLGINYTEHDYRAGKPLPFDAELAFSVFEALLKPISRLMTGKRLLVVPSGPLSAFPLHVLVTAKPSTRIATTWADFESLKWLASQSAIAILPSVASVRSLRQITKPTRAPNAYIGFGNPLLLGPFGTDRSAWEHQVCAGAIGPSIRARAGVSANIGDFFKRGLADVETVRSQQPLPETADELCATAGSTGGDDNSVYLGGKATERKVKELSNSGALAKARIIHFATHGVLPKETAAIANDLAEPALVMTPPETPSENDDGLLTASEIAALKLDADWVVLSACNTAGAGSKSQAEPFSGLAQAFLFAGARSLLVTHWYVDSFSAVAIATRTFAELHADPRLARSEALRRSMVSLISSGREASHPSNWAPFVLVGQGAR